MNKCISGICFPISVLVALAGCAVTHSPAQLAPLAAAAEPAPRALAQRVEFRLDTGYSRTLNAGSRWSQIGRIPQGDVYKPYKAVFTLEGAHIHEAYLVVENGNLTGFYLPAERGYSPLLPPVALPLQ